MAEQKPTMLGSMMATLSVLYCFFLLAIFLVPLATDLIVPKEVLDSYHYDTHGVLEYVQIYLASVSILFLLYLLFGLARPRRSALNHTGHTSAFVRVGGLVFGIGSIAYLILRLIEDIYKPHCSPNAMKLARLLSLAVTVLQMVAVILCSRIKIDRGWGAPHFGCMHLVAMNLVTWCWTVYKESQHVMHLADHIKKCVHLNERGTSNAHNDDHPLRRRRFTPSEIGNDCSPLFLDSEEFFYPLQIEFVLIGKYTSMLASLFLLILIDVLRRDSVRQHLASNSKA